MGGEIQIRGVTLVNDEIVIENKDALGAFDVTKNEDLSIFQAVRGGRQRERLQ